jgi:hypothetical protein
MRRMDQSGRSSSRNRPASARASRQPPLPFWRGTSTPTSNAAHLPSGAHQRPSEHELLPLIKAIPHSPSRYTHHHRRRSYQEDEAASAAAPRARSRVAFGARSRSSSSPSAGQSSAVHATRHHRLRAHRLRSRRRPRTVELARQRQRRLSQRARPAFPIAFNSASTALTTDTTHPLPRRSPLSARCSPIARRVLRPVVPRPILIAVSKIPRRPRHNLPATTPTPDTAQLDLASPRTPQTIMLSAIPTLLPRRPPLTA